MRTALARDLESDHQESEGRPTVRVHLAVPAPNEPGPRSFHPTQGRKIGSDPYDDATQRRKIGSDPYDDPTQGWKIGS